MGFWDAVKGAAKKYQTTPEMMDSKLENPAEFIEPALPLNPAAEQVRLEKKLFELWDFGFTVFLLEKLEQVLVQEWQELKDKKLIDQKESLAKALVEPVMKKLFLSLTPLPQGFVQEALNRLASQRWLFFKEPAEVIFDQTTGCLWPNFHKTEVLDVMSKDYPEVLSKFFHANLDNWELPTKIHLKYISQNPRYPFLDADLRLQGLELFGIYSDRLPVELYCLRDDSLVNLAAPESRSCFLPCNRTFANQPFAAGTSSDKYYKAFELLRFLMKQGWKLELQSPYFAKEYDRLTEGLAALTQYVEIRVKRKLLEQGQLSLFSLLDTNEFLEKYPAGPADQRPLVYWEQAGLLLTDLDQMIQDLLEREGETFEKIWSLQEKLQNLQPNEALQAADQAVLLARQQSLAEVLAIDFEQVQGRLEQWFSEVSAARQEWLQVAETDCFFAALAKKNDQIRPPFALVVDYAVRYVNSALSQLQEYLAKQELVALLVATHVTRSKNYENFVLQKLPTLAETPEELEMAHKTRFRLEQAVTALVKTALAGRISAELLAKFLKILTDITLTENHQQKLPVIKRTVESILNCPLNKDERIFWKDWMIQW